MRSAKKAEHKDSTLVVFFHFIYPQIHHSFISPTLFIFKNYLLKTPPKRKKKKSPLCPHYFFSIILGSSWLIVSIHVRFWWWIVHGKLGCWWNGKRVFLCYWSFWIIEEKKGTVFVVFKLLCGSGYMGSSQQPTSFGDPQEISSDNVKGLCLAISSSLFIGSSFIIKKKGLQKAGASGVRAGIFYFSSPSV